MILVLKAGLPEKDLHRIERRARESGLSFRLLAPLLEGGRRLLALEGGGEGPDPDLLSRIQLWPGVERLMDFREGTPACRGAPARARVLPRWTSRNPGGPFFGGERFFGPESFHWIAGPCAIDRPEFLGEIAGASAMAGASMLRGGAFKPRTSPYSFRGLGREGLLLLATVARDLELPFVTEVLDPRDVDFVAQHADMLQIGARNMQNFPLLEEAGASGRPVLLKRGLSATMEELLASAEYVLGAGCRDLVLCERGVRSFDPDRRHVLDLALIPALRERTRLPVIVDPSHATGSRALVGPMAKASVAAGADGVMTEVHSRPELALSDGAQALLPGDLETLGRELRALARLEGRTLPHGPMFRDPSSTPPEEALRGLPPSRKTAETSGEPSGREAKADSRPG